MNFRRKLRVARGDIVINWHCEGAKECFLVR